MLYITYTLNFLLMIGLPIALGIFLARRFKLSWKLFAIGALTFILSQATRLPLLLGLTGFFQAVPIIPTEPKIISTAFNIIVLSLTAGIFEEGARYVGYRWIAKDARSWPQALGLGTGHGGIEAIIFGALAGLSFANMVVLKTMDLSIIPNMNADQLALLTKQVADYWSAPIYLTILGAVERVFALCTHLALSVIVLQVFTRRQGWWLALAIGWHALADGVSVSVLTWANEQFGSVTGGVITEGVIGLFAIAAVVIIFALRDQQPIKNIESPTQVSSVS